jgi:thiamine thiazole synthase
MAIFSKISEKDVSKAIVSEFADEFLEYVESDVIIVGAGPSGLIAAKRLVDKGVKLFL